MALNRIMVCECRHPGIESERILNKRQILLSGEKNKLISHGKKINICSLNGAHKFIDIASSLIAIKRMVKREFIGKRDMNKDINSIKVKDGIKCNSLLR